MAKGNPFHSFLKKVGIAILLLLWVIFPDFIPLIIDDVIAFFAAMVLLISSFKDMLRALEM